MVNKRVLCPRCTRRGIYPGVREISDYRVVNYEYSTEMAYCSRCDLWLDKPADPDEDYKQREIAFHKKAEILLRKNYPPDKYEYVTQAELLQRYPERFTSEDLGKVNPNIYFIPDGSENRIFLAKSVEVFLGRRSGKHGCESLFNITQLEDWSTDTKENAREQLLEFLSPESSKYLTREQAIKWMQAESPFWINQEHMDFFTWNMVDNGQQIYLRDSVYDYVHCYFGLFNIKEHAMWDEGDPMEYPTEGFMY